VDVVDLLEPIEVEVEHRQPLEVSHRPSDLERQHVVERTARQKPREWIVCREVGQLLLLTQKLGDVADDPLVHPLLRPRELLCDRRQEAPHDRSVLPAEHHRIAHDEPLLGDGLAETLPVLRARVQLPRRHRHELVFGVPEQVDERPVHVHKVAVVRRDVDRITR
jgi:hypothetical protein